MEFSEKMIEDLIVDSIESGQISKLEKRGLGHVCHYHQFFRQFDLGEYGRLDLVGLKYEHAQQWRHNKKFFDINVIEIKKGEINSGSYLQAIRYCKGIEVLLEKYNMEANFHITLIGSSVCSGDFIYLPDVVDNLTIFTICLDLDNGITFKNHHGYRLNKGKQTLVSEVTIADLQKYVKGKIREYLTDDLPF